MSSLSVVAFAIPSALVVFVMGYLVYVFVRYSPIVARIFEEPPVFAPLRVSPEPGAEEVRFRTTDNITLAGSYLKSKTPTRAGVVVFCHEYLSDRWSGLPYCEGLRESGFDIFTFDFRNHGDSETDATYRPLQWVSDLEATDLKAALAYLRTRPDYDPAGVGFFGVSRGGGTALCVASQDPLAWGVVTDGAFPTRGTVFTYILRWAEIYVGQSFWWRHMPHWVFAFAGWAGRVTAEWRLGRRYLDVERAVARLAPRPWLAIHGEKDAYIGPEIARDLVRHAREPKELWIVPGAKHNRCRELEPDVYRIRILDFFRRSAPRHVTLPQPDADETARAVEGNFAPQGESTRLVGMS